jgi:hypothetical protein
MRWTTRSHLHLDRTASAWLLRGFVDPDAEFVFLDWDVEPDASDPCSFGMPGVVLSSHDDRGTCFAKILHGHGLDGDPVLVQLERAVAAGVRRALGIPAPPEQTEADSALGGALDTLGVGLGLLYPDDHEHLAAATPLYDALYHAFRAERLDLSDAPADRIEQIAFVRRRLGITAPLNT